MPRANTDKRKMGRRIDGLYTSGHHGVEVGGIELGPEEQDSTGGKYQHDSLKLQKLLKDQFDYALIHTSAIKQDFDIMGLQLLGCAMQALTMDWVSGRFYRVRRDDQYRVPQQRKMIRELLVTMSQIIIFHERMRGTIGKLSGNNSVSLLERLTGRNTASPQKHSPNPTASSPPRPNPKKTEMPKIHLTQK
ncbi:hypothetical protein EDD21DRAFT_414165 [Dissophora ornata]|nr:hypothetical protein EDD21DRAFT_414165 [Dissophora ornata]